MPGWPSLENSSRLLAGSPFDVFARSQYSSPQVRNKLFRFSISKFNANLELSLHCVANEQRDLWLGVVRLVELVAGDLAVYSI